MSAAISTDYGSASVSPSVQKDATAPAPKPAAPAPTTPAYNDSVATIEIQGHTATVSYANGVATVDVGGKSTVVSLPAPSSSGANGADTVSLSAEAQAYLSNDQAILRSIEAPAAASAEAA